MSITAEPDFTQFYNHIIVMGLQSGSAENPFTDTDSLPIQPLIAGAKLNTNPFIAWSKQCVVPLEGLWSQQQLNIEANITARRVQSIFWSGSTTIPLNLNIKLFDKFSNKIAGSAVSQTITESLIGDFLVVGITHNVDLQSKTCTTNLSLQMIGNINYDSTALNSVL
jgi:hypothetical protein